MSIQFSDNVTMLDAVAATTTSETFDISKRQLVSIQFIADTGLSVFTIDASNDGTNWVTGIAFLDSKATATGTSVTSKSVSSSTAMAIVNPSFRYIRVVATYTSGTASAVLESKG